MAINFNGTDQAIKEANFATDFDQPFTQAIKFKGAVSAGNIGVIGAYNTSNTENGAIYLRLRDDLGGWVAQHLGDSDANTFPVVSLTNDVWHTAVIVNNGDGTADFYLNDDAPKTLTYSSTNKTLEDIIIGAAVPFGNATGEIQWFDGKCAYYRRSKTAISAADAAAYNSANTVAEINAVLPDGADLIENATVSGSAAALTSVGTPTYDTDDPLVSAVPTTRKGSTFDIETTLGTITTATLNGVNVFDHVTGQVGTTVSFAGAATDEITTSGEYTLTLGDGTSTENITVQVNVVGLASFNINKDGADQGSLTDVEFIILTGAAGSRAINDQIINITTTVGGDTGAIEITDAALNAGDTIMVAQRSDTVSGGGGAFHPATLGFI